MKRTPERLVRLATLATGLFPALALAHPGHGETPGFLSGMLHPASGVDHLIGFLLIGVLATRLDRRVSLSMTAVFLGLLVAASTADSDGWQYAAGFMFTSAGLIAAAMAATRAATSLVTRVPTAAAPRSLT
jgi:urease accessory protein